MKKAVMCIVPKRADADAIVGHLKAAGFSNNDISVIFPNHDNIGMEKHTKAPEGAAAGGGIGGIVGGTLGLLAGIGLLAIPGLGPLIAAGPILAALSGAAAGAAVGSISGALIGLGIPEMEAKHYEAQVKGGNTLVSVHCEDDDEIVRAKNVFHQFGGQDISASYESKGAPSQPIPNANVRRF